MLKTGRRRRMELHPNADINLVNLVDLAFVLLIIFIITAPILQGGIEVQLPKAASGPVTSDDGVVVTMDRTGVIYIGEVKVQSLAEFETVFPSYMARTGKKEAYLRVDENARYGQFLQLFGLMRKLNVAEVGLLADPKVDEK